MERHISRVTLVATGVFAFSATCLADAWEFAPKLSASGGYDDNLNQSDVDKEGGYEYNLSGILGLRRLTGPPRSWGRSEPSMSTTQASRRMTPNSINSSTCPEATKPTS
ncbi:MAG: hypothetical protein IPJ33_04255 [Gammaproteobacteria bacterium]|nr:hypothetical protein [Gammaproteobacteria bacterium]